MKLGVLTPAATTSNTSPAASPPGTSGAPAAELRPPARDTTGSRPPLSMEAARHAAARINEFLKSSAASVEFAVDSTSDHVIVRVIDSTTRQVIRQMPSEETLAVSRALDHMTGLLLAQKA